MWLKKRNIQISKIQFITLLAFHSFLTGCFGIHLEAVLVPQSKFRGQNATLLCKYELEPNEELFSLKWYKEETEFYRYTPPETSPHQTSSRSNNHFFDNSNFQDEDRSDSQQEHRGRKSWHNNGPSPDEPAQPDHRQQPQGRVQTWNIPGIKIDLKASTPQRVVLKKVSFKSTGMYRCEVTAAVVRQMGSFDTPEIQGIVMKESINRMTVVELPGPDSNPIIEGGGEFGGSVDKRGKAIYKPGDLLNLTCESAPSNPPATLEWLVNGQKVDEENIIQQRLIEKKGGLFSSKIGLELRLRDVHFDQKGQLRVLCRGTIEAEFWKKDVENIFNDKDSFVKVLEIKESLWPDSSTSVFASSMLVAFLAFLNVNVI